MHAEVQWGPISGKFNASLVNPDYMMYAPRFGGAWSPKLKWTKQLVIRGGYGVNYNTGQYATVRTVAIASGTVFRT